jgi:hypothetical protein
MPGFGINRQFNVTRCAGWGGGHCGVTTINAINPLRDLAWPAEKGSNPTLSARTIQRASSASRAPRFSIQFGQLVDAIARAVTDR